MCVHCSQLLWKQPGWRITESRAEQEVRKKREQSCYTEFLMGLFHLTKASVLWSFAARWEVRQTCLGQSPLSYLNRWELTSRRNTSDFSVELSQICQRQSHHQNINAVHYNTLQAPPSDTSPCNIVPLRCYLNFHCLTLSLCGGLPYQPRPIESRETLWCAAVPGHDNSVQMERSAARSRRKTCFNFYGRLL